MKAITVYDSKVQALPKIFPFYAKEAYEGDTRNSGSTQNIDKSRF